MKYSVRSLFRLAASIFLLSSILCAAQHNPIQPTTPARSRRSPQVQANYGNLPLTFEANQGQTDPRVKFLARGHGYSLFLTSGQMVLTLRQSVKASAKANVPSATEANRGPHSAVIQINLVNANPNPTVVGEDLQAGKANYFIGRDPKKWRTNISIYKQVRYENVYPGIDLVYYGNQSRVEHDFIVRPGADPNQVQFDVKGADGLAVASNGDLVVKKGSDEIHLRAPDLFQEVHGARVPVTGQYSLKNSTSVSFTLSSYDKSKTLVIDPVLVYGTYLGGLAYDEAYGIAVDSAGSAYVVGQTESANFPLAAQAGPPPSGENIFLAKLDVSGSSLVYADYIGGNGDDSPKGIVLDGTNRAFLTGNTYSFDFPVVNAYQPNRAGGRDVFLTEVAADGASLEYSTYLGGTSDDWATAVGLDANGNVYLAGYTYSQNYPMANAFQSTVLPNGGGYYGSYGFLTKIAPDGSAPAFSTYYGGNSNLSYACYSGICWPSPYSTVNGLAVDGGGNAYVTGNTNTYNFPVTETAYQGSNNDTGNRQVGFVGKFSASGNLIYSTYFNAVASSYWTYMNAIAVDATGSAYAVGETYSGSNSLPLTSPNLCDPAESWCSNGFVIKFDPTGSPLMYSTFLATNVDANPSAIRVDVNGNAYVASESYGGNPNMTNPVETYTNDDDVFLQKIDPIGGTELFSSFLGGYGSDYPNGLAIDSSGDIYVAGYTDSTDYPVTAAALQNTSGGNGDAFVTKIAPDMDPAVSISPSLIQFSIRPVGSVSQPNTALLRNMGSVPLNISNLTTTGDFSVENDCGTAVEPAGTCTFTVTFTPTEPGPRFGSIMIEDDAAGSPHFINLVGNGATAVARVSPASLAFPSLQINQSSSAQIATLTNSGNATLVINDVQIAGDYAQTNNCPESLSIGSSCQFQITFTPTAGGARDGTLTVTDNAPGSQHMVSMTGSGYVTTATIAPLTLVYGNQTLGTTSSAQTITVTNTGTNAMTVSAVTAAGDFSQTNNCTANPVAAAGSCTISVTFSPTPAGNRSGSITISDNAEGNPHVVDLSGSGLAGTADLSSTSLTFTSRSVGTTSSAQTITVTNSGNGVLTVSAVTATGDFAQTNNCTTVAASGGTCAIQVTFTPTSSGSRTGTLTLTDSAADSPQLVSLTGSGIDFSMPASGGSATVQAGGTATYNLPISAVGGDFSSAVSLTCAGVPAFSTCTVDPSSLTPTTTASTVTVSIKTTGAAAAQLSFRGSSQRAVFGSWTLLPAFSLFGMILIGRKPGRRHLGIVMLLVIGLAAGLLFCAGCGTVTRTTTVSSTPPSTYTVLVVGTSGSVQHFTSFTLTVQ